MAVELLETANIFQPLLKEAERKRRGEKIEITTFAQDTVSELRRTYSHLGIKNERELNQALSEFILELVPKGESRESLEVGFQTQPDRIKHCSHYDEVTSEWNTVFDNLIVGVRAIRDLRGESVRTWYLKKI
jgi:hypothetical protein